MAVIWLLIVAIPWVLITVLVVVVARTGRREGDVTIPGELVGAAEAIRARANRRTLVAGALTGALVIAGVAGLSVQPTHVALPWAALAAGAAASLVVAVMGPQPTPAPAIRHADLTPRTPGGFGPRWAYAIPAVLATALVLLALALGASSSDPDGQGSALAWTNGEGASGWTRPYPGWDSGLPLLVGLGLAAGCFLLALRRVAGWPRPPEAGLFALDDEVRRATTRLLLFQASGSLLVALGSIALVATRAWDTAQLNQRMASTAGAPALDSTVETAIATAETAIATAESALERALDLLSLAAVGATLAGLTFLAVAVLAGWVRSPVLAVQPAAHR